MTTWDQLIADTTSISVNLVSLAGLMPCVRL